MEVLFIFFTFQNLNIGFLSYFFIFLLLSSLSLSVPSSSCTMSTGGNFSTKKRKNKSKNPPGPDQAVIGWREEEFQNLVRDMGFRSEWDCQFPTPNSTAFDAPPGYITLYAAFFREGNFRLPMTKFTVDVLTNYGLHISQINALGLPLLHISSLFVGPTTLSPHLNCSTFFYFVSFTGGFYSFNSRTGGVTPCSSNPPKSLHDWKQNEGIPKVDVTVNFAKQEWYKKLTHKATSISQLKEMALVGAGMSMLWVPKNPFGVPVYVGYNLLNVLDPKAGGAMMEAIQAEGKPTWLDQIRDREDNRDGFDDTIDPTREEVIVLSSEGSDRSLGGLTPHSARAGLVQGVANEPVNEPVDVDVEVPVETVEQLETRRKKQLDKSEGKEKRAEEKATETPRKRPSILPFLDYVVVSDTLSSLGAGKKRGGSNPDDSATLTEMMKKKALEDKKRKLDEQTAAMLASKRAKLQKETSPAPSESEIGLEVFTVKHGNLLEKIFVASGSRGSEPGKTSRKIDISKITPPSSPPSRTFGLSTPLEDPVEKDKQVHVEVEQIGEGGVDAAGGVGGDGRGKGADSEAESSEATQRRTIYTRRPPAYGVGATSRVPWVHEFEHVQAGSWDTHNPACDDLLHAPRWNLTQDDHIHVGVNFFATSQEIVREWKLMGEEIVEFENEKKAFAEEREKFNAEKKGLLWRVSDAEQKLTQEKQANSKKQKDWEIACERTNKELQAQREAIVRISSEKHKISEEAEQARVASQKREEEYLQRIAKLEKFGEEKVAECKASELLVEEVSADCKWILSRVVPLIAERIVKSHELANYMFELGQAAYNSGRKDGYNEGRVATASNEKDYHFELYKEDCSAAYAAKRRDYEFVEFGIVKAIDKLSRRANVVEFLKKALGDESRGARGAGPSRQD
ncbi:hypothetical protein Hanom_Chr12g01160671 [Helianthus anomalus]